MLISGRLLNTLLLFFASLTCISAQVTQYDQFYKTSDGVLYYAADSTQVTGFGVNYTVPFAHARRQARNMGIDPRKAIDQDVYHFARLGFDLYRVHVWDTEISDSLGNLLANEHLELFDYLLARLQEYGIRAIITPIAFWGNGWPEPDEPTPGFSHLYGKDSCLVNPDAIRAQENYLHQFVSHVNRYTGVAYKDDPKIIAFEISNEPHHRGQPAEVTAYVQRLKNAIRNTGCRKPVLYNVTHSIHLVEAYFDAGIDGGTFQWYPTGLGYQKAHDGNMLPNVDAYPIPFDDVLKRHAALRYVYEFDAADMASGYLYPAMARSFRSAGIQLATHFSYDPTYLAPFNTEYNTHYMNLVYAPRKALSLMLCGEIFKKVPLYSDVQDKRRFGEFRLDESIDLAEMVTEEAFIYTNHTTTLPPSPELLQRIAGWGNSSVVSYDGTGAYFLDKVDTHIWILEITPDAIQVDNLFGRNSPEKVLVEIHRKSWPMSLHLPGMEKGVIIIGIDNEYYLESTEPSFEIAPGKYVVASRHLDFKYILDKVDQHHFHHPLWLETSCASVVRPTLQKNYVLHTPHEECSANQPLRLHAVIAAPVMPDSVFVRFYHHWRPISIHMERDHGYQYSANIPAEYLQEGRLNYWITTLTDSLPQTWPSEHHHQPGDWEFDASISYTTEVVNSHRPLVLFDAHTDADRLNRNWLPGSRVIPGDMKGHDWLYLPIQKLMHTDPENPDGLKIADYSMRHYFREKILGRIGELTSKDKVVLIARVPEGKTCPVAIKLVQQDGAAFGTIIQLAADQMEYEIPIHQLKSTAAVLLPRPYPTFLPYYTDVHVGSELDVSKLESLQIAIGPGIPEDEVQQPREVWIQSVSLR